MVCPRCIMCVREILNQLKIPYKNVSLGEVKLKKPLSRSKRQKLQSEFEKVGFEIIYRKKKRIVEEIKMIIILGVDEKKSFKNKENLSDILSKKIGKDYSFLSALFSKQENKTIQSFLQEVKVERVKI